MNKRGVSFLSLSQSLVLHVGARSVTCIGGIVGPGGNIADGASLNVN